MCLDIWRFKIWHILELAQGELSQILLKRCKGSLKFDAPFLIFRILSFPCLSGTHVWCRFAIYLINNTSLISLSNMTRFFVTINGARFLGYKFNSLLARGQNFLLLVRPLRQFSSVWLHLRYFAVIHIFLSICFAVPPISSEFSRSYGFARGTQFL